MFSFNADTCRQSALYPSNFKWNLLLTNSTVRHFYPWHRLHTFIELHFITINIISNRPMRKRINDSSWKHSDTKNALLLWFATNYKLKRRFLIPLALSNWKFIYQEIWYNFPAIISDSTYSMINELYFCSLSQIRGKTFREFSLPLVIFVV